jgi:farnesyl diphosphate synthase
LSLPIESLKPFRARLERALEARLPDASAPPARLHEAMRYATLDGGKRIRACLVYAAGEACGAAAAALDAPACAVELLHAYSLVHDDLPCMDNDTLRRGKPTCHKAFGEATALLVGDALQSLAFEILAHDPEIEAPPARRLEMIALLAQAAGSHGMAGGQAMDLEAVGKTSSLPELDDCYLRKTGALIRAGVLLAALAAPAADEKNFRALDEYGRAVGLMFQIADDVLDAEGAAAALGKRAGTDAARGKPTYPSLLGLDGARELARRLHTAALESLTALGDNDRVLSAIADFVVTRRQ